MLYKRKRISNRLGGKVWIRVGFMKTKDCANFCSNQYCRIKIIKNRHILGFFQDICLYKSEGTEFIVYVLKEHVYKFRESDIINYYNVI